MRGLTIGKLDKRIKFQTSSEEDSDYNSNAKVWSDIAVNATVWARVSAAKTGNNSDNANQITYEQSTIFHIRYRTDLTMDNTRIIYNNSVYTVKSIVEPPDYRKQLLEVRADLNHNEIYVEGPGFTTGFSLGYRS